MKFKTEIITFSDIQPIWEKQLWPNRQSPIKPMSSMLYQGGYSMDIYDLYTPTFFAVLNNSGKIIGVNSGHRTAEKIYRSRGIWVDPVYRNKKVSGLLFCELFGQAMKENCEGVWSVPRKEALPAYEKVGFKRTSDFFDEGMEFGPNCYVYATLDYELKVH